MITIPALDGVTLCAVGRDEAGKEHQIQGTWAFAPELMFYDRTDRRWLEKGEFKYVPWG